MWMLGFPEDLIQNVQNIYTNATTSIKTTHTQTQSIAVDRGTLQGDSLSPFLFDVFMEPLLRWLQNGGRGYQFGSIPPQERRKYTLSNNAYADDLQLLTNNIQDMEIQATKVTLFSNWGVLEVNINKSFITAAKWTLGEQKGLEVDNMTELSSIKIQKQIVPTLPPKDPFTYLGAKLTMNLTWTAHHNYIRDKMKTALHSIMAHPYAHPAQKRYMIDICVKPIATTFMAVIPYSNHELERLDAIITAAHKKTHKLMQCTPSAFVRNSEQNLGLGCTSLKVEYTHRNIKALIQLLNQPTWQADLLTHLLNVQWNKYKGLDPTEAKTLLDNSLALRQLACVWQTKGMELRMNDNVLFQHMDSSTVQQMKQCLTTLPTTTTQHHDIDILTRLFDKNIHNIHDIMEPGTYTIRTASDMLKNKLIDQKDTTWFNKLTLKLTQNQLRKTPKTLHMHKEPCTQHRLHFTIYSLLHR